MGFLRALAVAGGRRHRKLFPFLLVWRRRKFWGLLLPRCSVMEFPREESGGGVAAKKKMAFGLFLVPIV